MSNSDDEVTKSFALVMRCLADLSLQIETCRVVMRAHGATKEEFETVRAELKRRWDAQADAGIEAITEQRAAEQIRRILNSTDGTEH